jgi:Secretion system C-terminal sorting domain
MSIRITKNPKRFIMRKHLLTAGLLTSTILLSTITQAQSVDRFAYAITDIQKEGSGWNYLRKLDLRSGKFSDVILNGLEVNQVAYDATSKKQLTNFPVENQYRFSTQPPFSSGVAAIAYDRKNNRIWFTPMFIDQLRYIDLKTMKVFYVTDNTLIGSEMKNADQSNIVTRMVIADDGNGYAITNDGNNLVRFNTKKLTVTNLGILTDAPENKGVSIHNSCSSYGGDMIADDNGNLIIVSARNTVFRVNIESKVATMLGTVKNLPKDFTSNGMVVNDQNQILLSSAVNGDTWAILSLDQMSATPFKPEGGIWRSSDLANSNVLQTKTTSTPTQEVITRVPLDDNSNKITVYPNPVSDNRFTVQFSQLEAGVYTMTLNDVMGRQVVNRSVNISGIEHAEYVNLNNANAKGVYLIKLTSQNSRQVYTKKIVVQ